MISFLVERKSKREREGEGGQRCNDIQKREVKERENDDDDDMKQNEMNTQQHSNNNTQ